jgi:tight adherence protein B
LARAQEAALRAADDARAATAQARFTGLVVGILPAGAAGLAELASPGSLANVLRVPIAAWLAGFAMLLQGLAVVAIRRLGRVEVGR